jgi:hypothetical protein
VLTALPANGAILSVYLIPSSLISNDTSSSSSNGGTGCMPIRKRDDDETTSYNMTIQYSRTGKDDSVLLWYNFPDPSNSENRFYQGGSHDYPGKQASNSL